MSRAASGDPPGALKDSLDASITSSTRSMRQTDPIQIVRRFENPADREVVGFCAAALAFGRVASVLQSIERLVCRDGAVARGIRAALRPGARRRAARRLVHRWTRGADLVALVWILRQMLEDGIDRGVLPEGLRPRRRRRRSGASNRSRARARDWTCGPPTGGYRTGPASAISSRGRPRGSACKRLNLFLRWMVRRDAVDLGVWTRVSPARARRAARHARRSASAAASG